MFPCILFFFVCSSNVGVKQQQLPAFLFTCISIIFFRFDLHMYVRQTMNQPKSLNIDLFISFRLQNIVDIIFEKLIKVGKCLFLNRRIEKIVEINY